MPVTKMIAYAIVAMTLQGYITQAEHQPEVKTHLFTGTMFHPIQKIIYVSSIPIVYKIPRDANTSSPIPWENPRSCKQKNNDTVACKIERNLNHLQREILKQLEIEVLNINDQTNKTRQTRGLTFISSFLKWCCDVATVDQVADIMENEEQFVTDANKIIDRVNSDHKTILNSTENFNNFSRSVGEVTEIIHSNINLLQQEIFGLKQNPDLLNQLYTSVQSLWKYQYLNYHYDNLREVKTMCHEHKIPKTLISREKLLKDINELHSTLKDKNLKPAIDNININLYFTLPITTCYITRYEILIKIKIPLKRADTDYKIYKNIPVPLHWQGKMCYATQLKYTIVASDQQIYVIDPDEENCDKTSNPLCLLPRHEISTSPEQRCIKEIIKQSPIKDLKENCQFTCFTRQNHLQVTKLLTNKYLITNIQNDISLSCPDHNVTKLLPKNRAGTVEIWIPCLCKVVDNKNKTIISQIFPCDRNDASQPEVTHLLPMAWTNFQTISIIPLEQTQRHSFDSAEEIIKQNWTLHVPTIFVDGGVRQDTLKHIKIKNTKGDLFNNTSLLLYILMGYCAFLTIFIIILTYCVVINNAKLKMLAPRNVNVTTNDGIAGEQLTRRRLRTRRENLVN